MAIFNLNTGELTESTNYPLSNQANFDNILDTLKDNTDRLVLPRSVRDSILSLWSGSPFKSTPTPDNFFSYIGMDSNDPADRDFKKVIFLGKRSFSGIADYIPSHDIMTPTLLGASSSDVYFFNTKSDKTSNITTKISILSGKIVSDYIKAPYIQSQYVSLPESLSLDFIAQSGNVNIASELGKVSINGISFPEIGTVSNNSTLFFNNNNLEWNEITFPSLDTLGNSSDAIDIIGSEVNVNNYPLELTSINKTPISLGGVAIGSSFDHVSLVDVLKRVIYKYLAPSVEISIDNNYAEIGTYPSPVISYKIYKRSNPTKKASLINMIPGSYPTITTISHDIRSGTASGLILSPPITSNQTNFTIKVNDDTVGGSFSNVSASTFIKGIYPYFSGLSDNIINQSELTTLDKNVEYLGDKEIFIEVSQNDIDTGNNWFHFIYDASYPDLVNIIDDNNNNITPLSSNRNYQSPNGLWSTKNFKTYKWQITTPIIPGIRFRFEY